MKKIIAALGILVGLTVTASASAVAAPGYTTYPQCQFVDRDGNPVDYPAIPVSTPCQYRYLYDNGVTITAYYDKQGKYHEVRKESTTR